MFLAVRLAYFATWLKDYVRGNWDVVNTLALGTSFISARLEMRVDPIVALRHE